jgi:diguanylate cyclase (GGDEF)-like protein
MVTPHQPSDPIRNRLEEIDRTFTRRWVTGIAIGYALVAANLLGHLSALREVGAEVTGNEAAAAEIDRLTWTNIVLSIVAVLVLSVLAVVIFRPMSRTLRSEVRWRQRTEAGRERETERQRFDAALHEALEMAREEAGTLQVVERVLTAIDADRPGELLLADSSDAHLLVRAANRTAGPAGCCVSAPFDCPAVRRASARTFPSSTAIDACPHLVDREGGARSAHCVPVTFMGRALGVLHVTGPDGSPPDEVATERLASLAAQVGSHLGTVRAFAKAQLQASTDSLTGLANRRAFEDEISRRLGNGEAMAIVMADLDHFKQLNDTYGHDAGDRALRMVADTLRRSLRTDDLAARWGGEEFVLAIPGADAATAVNALHRLRLALLDACARADTPPVTASFGVTDTSSARRLDELLQLADEALLRAKRNGRDRVETSSAVEHEADASGPVREPARVTVEMTAPLAGSLDG